MNIKTKLVIGMLVSFPSGDDKSRKRGRPGHSLERRGEDKAKLKRAQGLMDNMKAEKDICERLLE